MALTVLVDPRLHYKQRALVCGRVTPHREPRTGLTMALRKAKGIMAQDTNSERESIASNGVPQEWVLLRRGCTVDFACPARV
jgi:hypothetical protein